MAHKINHFLAFFKKVPRWQMVTTIIVILFVLGYILLFRSSTPSGDIVKVERGTVTQEVRITGNTKPLESVNLAFELGGKIVVTNVVVGNHVFPGQILASLDQNQLLAQRAEQQANIESEQAKLQEMRKGSRPEDVQIKQAALAKANQDLDSEYQGIPDAISNAYIKADDAIRKQIDTLFQNADNQSVQLSFSVNDAQLKNNLESNRLTASSYLNDWKNELSGLSNTNSRDTLDKALAHANERLTFFQNFLADLMTGVNKSLALSASQIDTYKANVTTARTNVNTVLTSINTVVQNISTKKLAIKQSEADLNRTLAGDTPESIEAQVAQVKQAEAKAQGTEAQLQKTILRAPFSGIVTKQDAKVGEIASPNTPLVSLISDGKLEIEANVPEADIGKVMAGNTVLITIDAFPGETFTGKIRYIDPAETIVDGVTNFKTKINFDKIDPRLKSGLTTNLVIKTLEKNNVLILPHYAITENSDGAFVEKKQGDQTTRVTITIGLRGQDGKVEILSGVAEGDTVISIRQN
jgi:HlyD family secretion protein